MQPESRDASYRVSAKGGDFEKTNIYVAYTSELDDMSNISPDKRMIERATFIFTAFFASDPE